MENFGNKKILVISDVDGCLTDGKFIYTVDGKVAKTFGPHDADGVKLLKANNINVIFVSADKRGFPITSKRINDMKCELYNVSEGDRIDWLKQYSKRNGGEYDIVVFFGDGIHDAAAASVVDVFIAPQNARIEAKNVAKYVTPSEGGNGAFLDLALFVVDNIEKL